MSVRPPAALDRPAIKNQNHLPSPIAAWLGSFAVGDSERRTSSGQQREPMADASSGPGLVQRCVIVQKDQLGFGFTVCGERVKLVQNVRPGGAAAKAGVQEGDRIIKVNGSLVSSMTHQEVVKLIKSGTYAALTLQGPAPTTAALTLEPLPTDTSSNQTILPPSPPPLPVLSSHTPSRRITAPKPLQDSEVQKQASQILRKMLEQEEAELQALQEELALSPSPSLEQRIQSAKKRAHQVKVKLQQDMDGARIESGANYLKGGEGGLAVDSEGGEFEPCDSLRTQQSTSNSGRRSQIIGPEDEDVYVLNEMDGPFQDIEVLKSRPAHMLVFMRYIFSQLLDPSPLLFFLSVETYLSSAPKDARSLAPQICTHFLEPDAPLKILIPEDYMLEIESRLQAQEDIRGPLSELQQRVLPDIQEQIQGYRGKQLLGLGALFGDVDLQQLDGDPVKERQVVDKQVTALWEILSKPEEERSASLASAVLLYLRHSGIKLRDSRLPSLTSDRDRWLAFFPKTKKLSGAKKEGEDRKRNPILKYIGKPRSSQNAALSVPLSPTPVRPGSVRNIIQQFESQQPDLAVESEGTGPEGADPEGVGPETAGQRLFTDSLGEQSNRDSPTVSVRLARSESLKAQGEGRRRGGSAGGEAVPRSRSDVDMEDCEEERPFLNSTSSSTSSTSSTSARSLENSTPPCTPLSRRRSVEAAAGLLPGTPSLDEDSGDFQNWQETVPQHTLRILDHREVDRQAVIYELYTTEASHLRTLRVLDQVFFQKMRTVMSIEQLACIFPNLPQVYHLHASLCESMKKLREKESPVVQGIGDVMLARFEGLAGAEFQEQVSVLCRQQSQALELIKSKQRKDPRFAHIIQECEASPHCRRLQLKDLLVSEMQRLTKYPLLLDNIIKHSDSLSPDLLSLQRAQTCCRGILQAVNEVVRETEHKQRLSQYQRRLDLTPLERQANPIASQFKNLDLTTKRMIHEGPLTWRVSKDKAIEVQALLLSDLLVLLQRGPDERLVLRCPSRLLGGGTSAELKTTSCPVVRLDSLLIRSVATDNKALYLISASEGQIYELAAGTSSEKNTWKEFLEKTISLASSSTTPANHGLAPVTVSVLKSDIYQSVSSVSIERVTVNDEEVVSMPIPSAEGSHSFLEAEGRDQQDVGGVAEAALLDVETLRQLIFRDLEDDVWNPHSDDTPTNDTANEKSQFRRRAESSLTEDEEAGEALPAEAELGVQVVRKAKGVGSASIPDDITDDVSNNSPQSDNPKSGTSADGNTFYLLMHQVLGETTTDPNSTAQEVTSSPTCHEDMDPAAPSLPSLGQAQDKSQRQEVTLSQSVPSMRSPSVTNIEEILSTIDQLMAKLQQLRDIELSHQQLLNTLTHQPVTQSADSFQEVDTGREASIEPGAGDREDSRPEIQSTGF